ncbi:PRC-barrel domain-containing protein [Georgenia sp. AZ-5]|uniref:PRC-barrel domain-containing protein n=1 Tax=Georgenia sp. AZ-5 TaxID=3367526 RepID=UPI003753FE2A
MVTDLDVRGRDVVTTDDEKIGTVDEILIDDEQLRVRFLRVCSGGFLGLGKDHFRVLVDVRRWCGGSPRAEPSWHQGSFGSWRAPYGGRPVARRRRRVVTPASLCSARGHSMRCRAGENVMGS